MDDKLRKAIEWQRQALRLANEAGQPYYRGVKWEDGPTTTVTVLIHDGPLEPWFIAWDNGVRH